MKIMRTITFLFCWIILCINFAVAQLNWVPPNSTFYYEIEDKKVDGCGDFLKSMPRRGSDRTWLGRLEIDWTWKLDESQLERGDSDSLYHLRAEIDQATTLYINRYYWDDMTKNQKAKMKKLYNAYFEYCVDQFELVKAKMEKGKIPPNQGDRTFKEDFLNANDIDLATYYKANNEGQNMSSIPWEKKENVYIMEESKVVTWLDAMHAWVSDFQNKFQEATNYGLRRSTVVEGGKNMDCSVCCNDTNKPTDFSKYNVLFLSHFETNSYKLSDKHQKVLDGLVLALNDYYYKIVALDGRASQTGRESFNNNANIGNKNLAGLRALTVARYLKEKGVVVSDKVIGCFGSKDPIKNFPAINHDVNKSVSIHIKLQPKKVEGETINISAKIPDDAPSKEWAISYDYTGDITYGPVGISVIEGRLKNKINNVTKKFRITGGAGSGINDLIDNRPSRKLEIPKLKSNMPKMVGISMLGPAGLRLTEESLINFKVEEELTFSDFQNTFVGFSGYTIGIQFGEGYGLAFDSTTGKWLDINHRPKEFVFVNTNPSGGVVSLGSSKFGIGIFRFID